MFFALIVLTALVSSTLLSQPGDLPLNQASIHYIEESSQPMVIISVDESKCLLSGKMDRAREGIEVNAKQKLTEFKEIVFIHN